MDHHGNGGRSRDREDDEVFVQRRLLQTVRELLDEVHIGRGSWDRALLEKYLILPLENILDGTGEERPVAALSEVGEGAAAASASGAAVAPAQHSGEGDAPDETAASFNDRDAAEGFTPILDAQEQPRELQAALIERVVKLVNLLAEHKQRTIDVLIIITKRREAYRRLLSLEEADLDEAELQSHALAACYHLRNTTLKAVEAIVVWRTALTLDHPFMFEQRNFLFTILAEMKHLSQLPRLSRAVALEFVKFPLFSNIPSLALFAPHPARHGGAGLPLPASQRRNQPGAARVGAATDPKLLARLQQAERYLHTEPERQTEVLKTMMALCARGRFVPVLDISCVYPRLFQQPQRNGARGALRRSGRPASAADATAAVGAPQARKIEGVAVHHPDELEKLRLVLMSNLEELKRFPQQL